MKPSSSNARRIQGIPISADPPENNELLKFDSKKGILKFGPETSGVTDHGLLTGLANDDHSQYHNDTRGDERYLAKENTTPFTPNADYEPATKKYVDESGGGISEDEIIAYIEALGD